MMPVTHLLSGLSLAGVLSLFFPMSAHHFFLAAVFSVMIDIDHLFEHHKKSGNFSVKETWNRAVDHVEYNRSRLHSLDGLIVFFLASLFVAVFSEKIGLMLFLCIALHFLLDWFQKKVMRFEEVIFKKFSLLGFEQRLTKEALLMDFVFLLVIFITSF